MHRKNLGACAGPALSLALLLVAASGCARKAPAGAGPEATQVAADGAVTAPEGSPLRGKLAVTAVRLVDVRPRQVGSAVLSDSAPAR